MKRFLTVLIFTICALSGWSFRVYAEAGPQLTIEKYFFRSDPVQYAQNRLYVIISAKEDFQGDITLSYFQNGVEVILVKQYHITVIANDHTGIFTDVTFPLGGDIELKGSVLNDQKQVIVPQNATTTVSINFDTDKDGMPNQKDTDDDNDGVPDIQEQSQGTNPLSSDSDGDGVGDAQDLFPLSSSESTDTDHDGIGDNADTDDDNDGILDTQEAVLGTNSSNADTDSDGISDAKEVEMGTNPLKSDTDGDGVNDSVDPAPLDATKSKDSDGDHIADEEEVKHNLDPKNAEDARLDDDHDTISNADEILKYHTDPHSADSDSDGLPDRFEVDNGLNPLDATDSNTDADRDGVSNKVEYSVNMNPNKTATYGIPDKILLLSIPIGAVFTGLVIFLVTRKRSKS